MATPKTTQIKLIKEVPEEGAPSLENKGGKPVERERIDFIYTCLFFRFLVVKAGGNGQTTDLALRVEPDKCEKADGGGTVVPRYWFFYRTGVTGPSDTRLKAIDADPRFRGSEWLYKHPLRRLLREKKPGPRALLTNIRLLPPKYVGLLLEDPNPVTGYTGIRNDLSATDLKAVQQLGHADALAALMSLSLLAEERNAAEVRELASVSAFELFASLMVLEPYRLLAYHIGTLAQERFFSGTIAEQFEVWLAKARARLDLLDLCIQANVVRYQDRMAQDRILAILDRFEERCGVHQLWLAVIEFQLGGQYWHPPPRASPILCEFVLECLAAGVKPVATEERKRIAQIERVLNSRTIFGLGGDRSDVRPGYFQVPDELYTPVQYRQEDQS